MLNPEQIQHLYKFCEKHYMRYYDVQVELVDHLANAIEEKMQQNPKLAFGQALDDVYKGFGISGFSNIVQKKETAISRTFSREYRMLFKSYFTVPRIMLTLSVTVVAAFLFLHYYSATFLLVCSLFFSVFSLWVGRFLKRRYKKPEKNLLSFRPGYQFDSLFLAWWLPFVYSFVKRRFNWVFVSENFEAVAFIIFFTVIIVCILADFEAYKKMYQNARKNYPLAFEN